MVSRMLMIGGDRRAECLCELLRKDGYMVDTFGIKAGDDKTARWDDAEAVLFPYPFSVKNGCIPALSGLSIHPEDVLAKLPAGAVILHGRGMNAGLRYDENTLLEARNAEISAEAAVCEAMQRMDIALMDARILVTGYGLFGRALARKLAALGAEVWVAARREEQRTQAADDGMKTVALTDAAEVLGDMHMVCNTIPAQVLDESALRAMQPGAWLLELASAPYGFDRRVAQKLDLRCDVLAALPARYAPMSAAYALRDAVMQKLAEV
ncbi:MAG: dipicolinate synthase subunit DpsA [bacterium]|nr:dipicolinate synthase subunit DpsA [bacterium]